MDSIDALMVSPEYTNNTEQEILHAELQHEIEIAVESLPPRCKQVFLMSRIESLSYKTISEILGISEKTVENHLVKALAILRTSLAGSNRTNVAPALT